MQKFIVKYKRTLSYILLAFLIFSYLFTEKKKEENNPKTYILYATFSDIEGIKEKSSISISGINVGTVKKIDINGNFSIALTMEIQNGFFIPDDSSAVIYTNGLLGEKYIEIQPGGSLDFLEDGDEIYYTQGAIDVQSLIRNYADSIKKDKEKNTKEKAK